MKLTAVYEPAAEGGYTCWVEEIPAAISEGDTLEEAEANLQEALALVLECQRELSDQSRSPGSLKKALELATA
jgi:predicted RNase H-like HicB family nuclease